MTSERRRPGLADRRQQWRGGRREADHQNRPIVLVVDDHADSRELMAAILGGAGIPTAEASTAVGALERLRVGPLPRIVTLDLNLPDRHGAELIRTIKADPATASIAIIVVSGAVTATDRRTAMDAGALAFLAKPVLPDLLVEAIRKVLGQVA